MFFSRVDEIRTRWDVLRHPFYVRWSRGELAPAELAHYAGQYRHAVVALAEATARAGDEAHAAQERAHVGLWDGFLAFAGGDAEAPPSRETAACATAWAGAGRDLPATLAALYAIESSQPGIAETKRAGLLAHYGAHPGSEATRYFDVHAVLDHDHAAHDRERLEALRPGAETQARLLGEVERALAANWELLDGVESAARR